METNRGVGSKFFSAPPATKPARPTSGQGFLTEGAPPLQCIVTVTTECGVDGENNNLHCPEVIGAVVAGPLRATVIARVGNDSGSCATGAAVAG